MKGWGTDYTKCGGLCHYFRKGKRSVCGITLKEIYPTSGVKDDGCKRCERIVENEQ